MTAYGRGEFLYQGITFTAEIKTVNHRFLDLHLRIPRNFQVLEEDLKTLIYGRIKRGRVEVSLQMVDAPEDTFLGKMELNRPLVEAYLKVLDELETQFGIEKGITAQSLLQMKDVVVFQPAEVDVDLVLPGFRGALNLALDSLEEMRSSEGLALETDFRKRISCVRKAVETIKSQSQQLVENYRRKLRERISEVAEGIQVDEGRLEQEVVLFADRSDITEELVRIASHLEQFEKYLGLNDVVGRRLDFLLQELNREVNTLAVKSSDATISKIVVEIKAELEKMREQAQNVE